MKTLYIECAMGAAGDMLFGGLLSLFNEDEQVAFLREINAIGLEDVKIHKEESVKCGIAGTHIAVTVGDGLEETSVDADLSERHDHHHHHHHEHEQHDHHHHGHEHHHHEHAHSGMKEIEDILNGLAVSESVKARARAVYDLIAAAEAKAHGKEVTQIHFHEVGQLDAVADIVGVCMLMERLAPEEVVVSPVHVGSGFVRCAHGLMPVPAPATAFLLQDMPVYGGKIKGELCTPTGAALLKYFANSFGEMPAMRIKKVGYGMGKKDFEAANCVRVFLGEQDLLSDDVAELKCNVDDMTGEQIGFACEQLMKAGALDVFTTAVQMKKNRPGVLITVLCRAHTADDFAIRLLRLTSTFGVRKTRCARTVLDREITAVGEVRVKRGHGFGIEKLKLEYDDLEKIAVKQNKPLQELDTEIRAALRIEGVDGH